MEQNKKRLLIALGILLLILLLIFFWPKKKETRVVVEEAPSSAPVVVEEPSLLAPLVTREESTPSQASVEAVARTFAERFASFSAESQFANIRDLYPLMTKAFQQEQETFIANSEISKDYYGVTSKLISLTTISFTESSAVMDVALQRVESRGSATNTVTKYETLRLDLVFQNDTWLVRGARWSK